MVLFLLKLFSLPLFLIPFPDFLPQEVDCVFVTLNDLLVLLLLLEPFWVHVSHHLLPPLDMKSNHSLQSGLRRYLICLVCLFTLMRDSYLFGR